MAGTHTDITERKGNLPLPVQGIVLHRAGEPDAAGITRDSLAVRIDKETGKESPTGLPKSNVLQLTHKPLNMILSQM